MSHYAGIATWERVLEETETLGRAQVWPSERIRPRPWLENFSDEGERQIAAVLLKRFTFLSDDLFVSHLRGAFLSISRCAEFDTGSSEHAMAWRIFCEEALVTHAEREVPDATQSGSGLLPIVRKRLGLDRGQMLVPQEAADAVWYGFDGPVVFLDDFVGSGEQFVSTMKRERDCPDGSRRTFTEMLAERRFYYVVGLCTARGKFRLEREFPGLKVVAGSILPEDYNLSDPNCPLWPAECREAGVQMIEKYGRQLGFDAEDGGERDWRGYNASGLALAFEHGTPDATLPIFHGAVDGWVSLVDRT